jgi:hypothetical protein
MAIWLYISGKAISVIPQQEIKHYETMKQEDERRFLKMSQ